MPTLSFGGSRLLFANQQESSAGGGAVSGSNFNKSISGSASDITVMPAQGTYIGYGYIDFTAFPSVPATASITAVRCKATPAAGNATAQSPGACTPVDLEVVIAEYDVNLGPINQDTEVINLNACGGDNLSDSFNRVFEWEVLFGIPITRTQLIARFGNIGDYPTSGNYLYAKVNGSLTVEDAAGNGSFSGSISSWVFEVDYDLEHYSWYIKPTTQIVNGLPTRVIASPDDIIAVPDGDPIPDEYEFYGTGDDYPDGPTYYWWTSEDYYIFYIFSPISPDLTCEDLVFPPTRCKGTWVPIGISPPTCVNCTSVSLGELEILVADASGVYRFDSSAKHDTLYVREGFSIFVDTVDVKIPNPFGKTGFIP